MSKNGLGTPAVYRPLLLKSESQFLNKNEDQVHLQIADQKWDDFSVIDFTEDLIALRTFRPRLQTFYCC
jgi:hypothetical protein